MLAAKAHNLNKIATDTGSSALKFNLLAFENVSSSTLGMNWMNIIQSQQNGVEPNKQKSVYIPRCTEQCVVGMDEDKSCRLCGGCEVTTRSHFGIVMCALMLLSSITVIMLVSFRVIQQSE